MEARASAERAISFGPFRLLPTQGLLVEGDRPLRLGSRALNVLITLVERAGELVSKDELMARVWPDTTVEESNLKVQVAGLRRALGDGQGGQRYLVTTPGRGYCFVAPISSIESAAAAPPPSAKPLHNLPAMLTRLIGRADAVGKLAKQLPQARLLTIVGTGGVGATSVALAVAEALLPAYEDGVWLVELAPLADPRLVPTALAAALGLEFRADDPLPGLIASLRDKQMLLVLDNCERVVEAAASLAVAVLRAAPRVHILATSREPLRAQGEHVRRLRPLASPPAASQPNAAEALAFPAVQLFVERAAASLGEFELSDADAPVVADICSKLDGVPLAIEFAAARVDVFGIRGLASGLDDRLRLLTGRRRTALPRHQTMRATLDWSYEFLPELERLLLRRLAIFAGAFCLEEASAVAASGDIASSEFADRLANLVAKSLVTADVGAEMVLYRLLETTRAYALEKLTASGEHRPVARRHAGYYRDLFERAGAGWPTRPAAERIADYGRSIDEVRAALDWAFSPSGDVAIGVALTVGATPLWFQLSLINECRGRVERALAALPETDRGTLRELALQEGLSISSMFTCGNSDEVRTAIERGLGLAEALGDRQHQLHLLAGLNIFLTRIGDFRAALAVAERSVPVARELGDAAGIIMSEWMLGVSHHLVGDQAAAQRHCEAGLDLAAPLGHIHVDFFGYDHRVRALVALARALWLRGSPERAAKVAHQAIDEAVVRNHPVTICIAFIYAIPVFLWTGDLEAAQEAIERLIAHASKYSLHPYHAVGLALRGELMIALGQPVLGIEFLQGALPTLRAERHNILTPVFCRALAEGLARCGRFDAAVTAIAEAVAFAERVGGTVDFPDLLRTRAQIMIEAPEPDMAAAEETLVRSLEWARKQSALGWELRAAIPLARLWAEHGRAGDARELVAGLYQRFTEGFETPDLKAARQLLDEFQEVSPGPAPLHQVVDRGP